MARYIDAEPIPKGELWEVLSDIEKANVLSYLLKAPTADVVKVKHGRWIEDGYAEKPCVCSYCGGEAQYVSTFAERFDYDWDENLQSMGYEECGEYIRTSYCPNCGAKMDGKGDGDEA